ncbi:MAG: hypothetical protein KIS87_12985 [Phycisphaeraceae bacterium]|nr:hypothetical protein [Phycisphaeraceae bacterium]
MQNDRDQCQHGAVVMPVVSVDELARKAHELWLRSEDRHYSPYNMPWESLSPNQRSAVSRTTRNVLQQIVEKGVGVRFVDEYAPPGPGDARWSDPILLAAGWSQNTMSELRR